MKRLILILSLAIAAGMGAGCGNEERATRDEHAHADEPGELGVRFSAKRGLYVPQTTAKFIGLQVVEVEERTVASVMQFSAHIYRAANEAQFAALNGGAIINALASASLSSSEASQLKVEQPVTVKAESAGPLQSRITGISRSQERRTRHAHNRLLSPQNCRY